MAYVGAGCMYYCPGNADRLELISIVSSQHADHHYVMQLAIPSLTAEKSSYSEEGERRQVMLMSVSRCCEPKSILSAENGANRKKGKIIPLVEY